jgi:lipopolysaccharide export system protein LptA
MRSARILLLAAIVGILAAVATVYRQQRLAQQTDAPPKPAPLPPGVEGRASDWHWTKTDRGRPVVDIRARDFQQINGGSKVELHGVRLRLYHQDGAVYDYVESAHAVFSPEQQQLSSDGEVKITLGIPAQGHTAREFVSIVTSGVVFDSATGRASTARPAEFTFAHGAGKSVGAAYDPTTRELVMEAEVQLQLARPGARPMRLEAGHLVYREAESKVFLTKGAKLLRGTSVIHASQAAVTLAEGVVRQVEAEKARGEDRFPQRQVDYAAEQLTVRFSPEGVAQAARGEKNATLSSRTPQAVTHLRSERVDLEFAPQQDEAVLTRAVGFGRSVLESRPLPAPGKPAAPVRTLRSEVIEINLRPGGQELDTLVTHSPGEITFLPQQPGERRRDLKGERISLQYGPRNALEIFRAVSVSTVTAPAGPGLPPVKTSSKHLEARFHPETGQMQTLEQWDDFRYQEGDRQATAAKGVLDQTAEQLILEQNARVWDRASATAADVIRLHQPSGDFEAEGRVTSSRRPDDKGAASPGMLGESQEPIQATASWMRAAGGGRQIFYRGGVKLWQGPNWIKADSVEIDREARRLAASGQVETYLVDAAREGRPRTPATLVRAAHLVYTDDDRVAFYSGGVLLQRANLRVRSLELRAHLAAPGAESRLERAIAERKVEIVQTESGRTRTGTAEHAEYEVPSERILLRGGEPSFRDSVTGVTRGRELTYFAADDRLLVNGEPERPAASRLRRK